MSDLHASAERLLGELTQLPGVRAVVLGGSRALGRARPDSDTDLGLYYHEAQPFDIARVRELAERVAVSPPTVTGFYEWGAWVNGGAWIQTADGKIDLLYRNLDHIARTFDAAEVGRVDVDYLQQPPLGFVSITYLAETDCCRPLHDPHGEVAALKARTATYPPLLRERWSAGTVWMTTFTLMHARSFAARGDVVNTVGCLTRCGGLMTQTLYALNRVYFINDKHAAHDLARFALCPSAFQSRLSALLAAPGGDAESLSRTVVALTALADEVAALAR